MKSKRKKGNKVDWAKRKWFHNHLIVLGTINYAVLHEYERLLRLESQGLTEGERVYYQAQVIKYRESIEAMSKLRDRLYRSVNKLGPQKGRRR